MFVHNYDLDTYNKRFYHALNGINLDEIFGNDNISEFSLNFQEPEDLGSESDLALPGISTIYDNEHDNEWITVTSGSPGSEVAAGTGHAVAASSLSEGPRSGDPDVNGSETSLQEAHDLGKMDWDKRRRYIEDWIEGVKKEMTDTLEWNSTEYGGF
ncbi:hypothetical protein BJ508DRAFT_311210 [Ascobolus immersus RN42]|uniref:Uncharacterized protein n=1 Tax=Ascobolus immersus RN42 TaxID=1160509 RepID=A0A3N4HTE6_ASCIM|nr:hypothetical protein BJ508DRAFT_311210 [Ascobolus immersus RN42]